MMRWIFLWLFLVRLSTSQDQSSCTINGQENLKLELICPTDTIIESFDFGNLTTIIESLQVIGSDSSQGPLTFIPEDICQLTELKALYLSKNRITNASVRFSRPCLSKLENINLNDNYLTEVPTEWLQQMSELRTIYVAGNQLSDIPYRMFHNISNVLNLVVDTNNLTTFELWLTQVKTKVDYRFNPVSRFTNNHRVDLSKYQSNLTDLIIFNHSTVKIDFDDGILEMYNRCEETSSTHNLIVKEAIARIHSQNPTALNWRCSCEQYYLQEYLVSSRRNNFSTWRCPDAPHIIYSEMCPMKSSFNADNVQPRLCKINQLKLCTTPENSFCYLKSLLNISDLEEISSIIQTQFSIIVLLNNISAHPFAGIIDESHRILQPKIHRTITESVQANFQLMISHIEDLIAHIRNPLEFIFGSVAILSVNKSSSINSFSQIRQNETSFIYSTEANPKDSTTTITIDQQSIDVLSPTDIYTFYYLPTSLFQFANEDQNIIIIPPIVGVYLPPNNSPRLIKISFTDIDRRSGRYSCVFWQYNRWNDSGCSHSMDSNRHYCLCNHTTSFALIFIPDKTISQTYIPSITIAIISIVCFCISIILSIYRQAENFRVLSITNIFNLINSIILFILLTVILFQGYRSNDKANKHCSTSQENLVIATYFFLISTFASKTFLGISYFLTIFFHFVFLQFAAISNRWIYPGFFLVLLIAAIPTIIIGSILQQWSGLFLQYQGICWLNTSVVFRFVSVPIIIFIGLNILIIIGITIRLLKFTCRQKAVKTNEKRLIVSMMIWLALCVILGIGWIFGPLLDVFIQDIEQTSSKIKLWFFGMFIGLEGVWVLMVNGIFYVNQKVNAKNRRMFLNKNKN